MADTLGPPEHELDQKADPLWNLGIYKSTSKARAEVLQNFIISPASHGR